MMSRVGDRYLRLTNQTDTSGNYIFDCAGALENDNFTSKSWLLYYLLTPSNCTQIDTKRSSNHNRS